MTKLSIKNSHYFFQVVSFLLFILSITGLIASAQTESQIVAVINGKKITQTEVDNSVTSQMLPLQKQIYALRKAALENLITRAVLEEEAKKRGVSVEELKKQLTSIEIEIPNKDVEQSYLENASAFAQMSPDEAKERIRLDMQNQARMRNYRVLVSQLREKARVELRLEEPVEPTLAVNDEGPAIGDKQAPVTIFEFSDFQCPFCKQSLPTIKEILEKYKSNVRLVFKHLPLEEIHSQALPAARAAFCAGEQGQFWKYHDALFASNGLSPETFSKIATEIGLDTNKFKACSDSETSRVAVLKDAQDAKRLSIEGTPSFLINGRLFRGVGNLEAFAEIIERELTKVRQSKSVNSKK
ncbi:MAG TPA: thioredoxin domain-containing protein [Pyrinomonadaceae bacterium]|jgi:protein-disulfide isomerase